MLLLGSYRRSLYYTSSYFDPSFHRNGVVKFHGLLVAKLSGVPSSRFSVFELGFETA